MLRRLPLILLSLSLLAAAAFAAEPGMHPPIRLLDIHGEPVTVSELPISPMQTCDGCHDTAYIEQTSFHATVGFAAPDAQSASEQARFDPLSYTLAPVDAATICDGIGNWVRRNGWRHAGGGPTAALLAELATDINTATTGSLELNCFLCHLETPANSARIEELEAGRFGWAATATLKTAGLVTRTAAGWSYDLQQIAPDGTVDADTIGLISPRAENCGLCHGPVYYGDEGFRHENRPEDVNSARTGSIFSPQRPARSGLNLSGKAALTQAWDIHAERLLNCADCHYTANNPAHSAAKPDKDLAHLRFDSRVLSTGEYLKRPDHSLVRGYGAFNNNDSNRRCTDCHDPAPVHTWLPFTKLHLASLECESCHIPHVNSTARMATDWTVLTAPGQPLITYRGTTGSAADPTALITGYQPVLLNRELPDGSRRYGPYNLMATWYWVAGQNNELVPLGRLSAALFTDNDFHPAVLSALDQDRDGDLSEQELRLDTPDKVEFVAGRLRSLGIEAPVIRGELQPYGIHHGVVDAAAAIRDCQACHGTESRLAASFELTPYLPGGVTPALTAPTGLHSSGEMVITDDGGLVLMPEVLDDGTYIAGLHNWPWIDILGILALLGVITGVAGHAALRAIAQRRQAAKE